MTYFSVSERDRQTVDADGITLCDNDFIDFDLPEETTLAIAAGTPLTGVMNVGIVVEQDINSFHCFAPTSLIPRQLKLAGY